MKLLTNGLDPAAIKVDYLTLTTEVKRELVETIFLRLVFFCVLPVNR